jgi:hypothetical protein
MVYYGGGGCGQLSFSWRLLCSMVPFVFALFLDLLAEA